MFQKLKNRNEGFTIIEVLIVLAIAGLIILIVFLAVPALQRNSRNTQRRNDISAILGAMNEYTANNNGDVPANDGEFTDDVDPLANDGIYDDASTTYYLGSAGYTAPAPGDATASVEKVDIISGARCNGDNETTASARQFVAIFFVESVNGNKVRQCQEG